jgi:hypothetical protein
MPLVEFEPTIPVFERGKIVHALDRAAIVIDIYKPSFPFLSNKLIHLRHLAT